MTVQRYQIFGWANPVGGGDGPFGGTYVRETDYDALATRLRAAEFLLLESDACIDSLMGDGDNERGRELLAAIERHWNEYPEPLEETSDV